MAVAAATVWEVRTTGVDTNGGGFVTGASGTDFSQQDAAQYALTGATTAAANAIILHASAAADMVGNIAQVISGTNFTPGLYQILSVVVGVSITVDRNCTTAAGALGVVNVGGALASPGMAGSGHAAGNQMYVKSGTYTVTSASTNIAAGCVSWTAQAANANAGKIFGYGITRGDGGTKPIIKADGVITTFTLFTLGLGNHIENLTFDGNNRTSSRGLNAANGRAYNCKGQNCTNTGIFAGECFLCEATGCATAIAMIPTHGFFCYSHDNTFTGLSTNGATMLMGCISANNSGASSHGFDAQFSGCRVAGSTFCNNGGDGYRDNTGVGNAAGSVANCILDSNGAYGINSSATHDQFFMYKNAFRNNTSGATNNITAANNVGAITLTADPFTNKAGGDFSLNNTSGGGAACRAAGLGGAFPGGTTTGYRDVGAVPHQDSGSSGGFIIGA